MMPESESSGWENLTGSRGNLLERMKGEGVIAEVVWMGRKWKRSFV